MDVENLGNSICIWSVPRSLSTALTYSFFGTGKYEHAYQEVLLESRVEWVMMPESAAKKDMPRSFADHIARASQGGTFVTKDHAYHMLLGDFFDLEQESALLQKMKHVVIVRNPASSVPSLAKKNLETDTLVTNQKFRPMFVRLGLGDASFPEQLEAQAGFRQSLKLTQHLAKILPPGRGPAVIDADRLLHNPREVLDRLCDRLQLRHGGEEMLSWRPTPPEEVSPAFKDWFDTASLSTSFERRHASGTQHKKSLSPEYQKHVDTVTANLMPLYQQLLSYHV
mmetsp:Transcript_2401/g.6695  ORF Transcript_2401/g.6695 Transcript_2401/m.6695 type:complete len:282 (-) Transcript_2401:2-847(-)